MWWRLEVGREPYMYGPRSANRPMLAATKLSNSSSFRSSVPFFGGMHDGP